jgi:hypothetical protein
VPAGRLAAVAGAGFALATLGGYLLSVWIGLFRFKEARTGAGIAAGLVEVAAFVALAALALAPAPAKAAADRAAAAPGRRRSPTFCGCAHRPWRSLCLCYWPVPRSVPSVPS